LALRGPLDGPQNTFGNPKFPRSLTFIKIGDNRNSNNPNKKPRVPEGKSDGAYL